MPHVDHAGARIYYEVYGEPGQPVVTFAHGAGGNAASWWQQVPFFVERGNRVLSFDHRGFARSPCAESDLAVSHFPGDLLAILDAEGVEKTALVCQSMGGWTGLPTAVHHPDRLRSLVLCGTPGGLSTEAVRHSFKRISERVMGIDSIVGPGGTALAEGYADREPEMAFLYSQIANMNHTPPALLASIAKCQIEAKELASFATPTLVIAGDKDLLFPPDVLREVAATIPGAEVQDFPGAGHSTYFEQADRFNAVVAEFIEKH